MRIMDDRTANKAPHYQFDFDIGYLIKSPCKACDSIKFFPGCVDACHILDEIHTILSEAISCSKN
jgi:hypothetical protein